MSQPEDMIQRRENYLKNRSLYLRKQMETQSPPELFSLVKEKLDSINEGLSVIRRIRDIISAPPFSDDKLSVPSTLRNSFRDRLFQRLEEIGMEISSLDEVWSSYIVFKDFSQHLSDSYLVLSKFLNEISAPLGRERFYMILPSMCFGYLEFPNISKYLFRIFVPISAINEASVWPNLAHELGHAYLFLPKVHKRIVTELTPIISERVKSICERVERVRENREIIEYSLSRSWYQWFMELGADFFALRKVGPSFVSALMFELMTSDPFSLSLEDSEPWIISTHPPPDFRIRLIIQNSRELFPSSSRSMSIFENMWDREMTSRVSDTLEGRRELYDLLCTNEVLQPFREKIVSLLNGVEPLQDETILPLEDILSSSEFSVIRALLSLTFREDPVENFIGKLAERIKQEASKQA